jgi:hypothetical protein
LVLLSAAGSAARISGTEVAALALAPVGVHFATRPSALVVAWKVTGLEGEAGAESRVRVTGRLAAGVPVKVLRQWQVMGSRDMLGGWVVVEGVDVDRREAVSCC